MINSYFHYGFIPEMCPSDDTAGRFRRVLDARAATPRPGDVLAAVGPAADRGYGRSLGEWTTTEHLAAGYDLVFHSRDVPPGIENAKNEARVFISRLEHAGGAPVPHAFDHYWVGGVALDWLDYRLLRQALGSIPRSDGTHLLIVRGELEQVDSLVNARESARFVYLIEVLRGTLSRSPGHRGHYTHPPPARRTGGQQLLVRTAAIS